MAHPTPEPLQNPAPAMDRSPAWGLAVVLALVAAGFAVYANTLSAGFILDDFSNILENPSIRRLFSFPGALLPPPGIPVSHRIVLNLSLALNWAVSGPRPLGFHLANVLLHLAGALFLYAILARSLFLSPLPARLSALARHAALAGTVLWMVHPLQTMAVAYVSQRGEVLAGLLLMASLYSGIRGSSHAPEAGKWRLLALLAFFPGIAVKENIGMAPLVLLAWTWVFLGKSPGRAVKEFPWLYAGFAAGLAVMIVNLNAGLTSIPFGRRTPIWFSAVNPWYQSGVILHYLSQSFWPHPLVFDYSDYTYPGFFWILPRFLAVLALFGATAWAVVRRRRAGFLGAWFFLLLAPTSSFLEMVDRVVEYRMYLPLAAVSTGYALGSLALFQRIFRGRGATRAWVALMVGVALILGVASLVRNRAYADSLAIWADTVAKRPGSPRAAHNYGLALLEEGKAREALPFLVRAAEARSETLNEQNTLAMALIELGQAGEAVEIMEQLVKLFPASATYRNTLGYALIQAGRAPEAVAVLKAGLVLDPAKPEIATNLGRALLQSGRIQEAALQFARLVEADSGHAKDYNNLAGALLLLGRGEEAGRAYARALALNPNYASAENGLGYVLMLSGEAKKALPHLIRAVLLDPESRPARLNLAEVLISEHRPREAEIHVRALLGANPGDTDALALLARVREELAPKKP